MKTSLKLSLSLFCCIFLHGSMSYANNTTHHEQSLDRIIAVVNDTPITETELNDALASLKKQMAASDTPLPSDEALHKQMLQQLVDKKLQLQMAEMGGIQIKDEQLDGAIAHIAEANNMTKEQLYEQLPKQGLNVAEYRKNIREEMLIQQVEQHEIGAKITITPQEIRDFTRSKAYRTSNNKEYHLEDLIVSLPDAPTSEQVQAAKKHADDIFAKINHGTAFHTAALAESSGDKALQGGDLGWRKLPEVPSAFVEAITHMQANEVAAPIQTPNGFHILHLAEVRDSVEQNTPSDKQIEQIIFQRKMAEAIPSWMAKMRSQAFVNMNPAE